MQIKTYRGESYSSLIRQIKKELGSDAVILSSDCINTKGKKSYEVVAALEHGPDAPAGNKPEHDIMARGDSSGSDSEWRMEWETFKNSFYKIIKNNVPGPNITKRQRQILEYLEKQGVYPEVIMDLWSALAENIHQPTLKILGDLVPTSSWDKFISKGRMHGIIGPSGAGKTTTVLRLALEARRNNPHWKICLVNTDMLHAGGRLYLKHYASLSGLHYTEITDASDWQEIKTEKDKFDLILVDTPGFGQDEAPVSKQVVDLLGMQCHMILSPVYGSTQIDHYLQVSRQIPLSSIIWTKVDEACSYGALVNASWKSKLPVSYWSFGKSLKESSSSATQENLWMLIFKKKIPGSNGAEKDR